MATGQAQSHRVFSRARGRVSWCGCPRTPRSPECTGVPTPRGAPRSRAQRPQESAVGCYCRGGDRPRLRASVWSWPVCLVARLGGVNTEPGPRGCSVGERASPLRGGRRSGPGDGPLFLSCTGLVSATLPVSSAGEEGGAAGHTGGPGGLCGTGLAMGVGPRSPREPRAAPSWLALRRPRGPGLPTSRRSETPQLPAGTETRPRPPAALPGRLHGVSARFLPGPSGKRARRRIGPARLIPVGGGAVRNGQRTCCV